MARPDASLVSVGRRPPTQSTMRTGGGPDQHDTGRVPSRRPIVTKFSVGGQIDPGSRPAKFGERGSIDADVVNYAYDGGPGCGVKSGPARLFRRALIARMSRAF
jgi:hypothetical protein